MSPRRKPPRVSGLSAEAVASFLRENPDFFELHPELLADLRVPHSSGSGAVSLVERQIELLRRQNEELRGTIEEYMANARASDELAGKLNRLVTELLGERDAARRLRALPAQLRAIFALDFVRLLLFDAAPDDCAGAAGLAATPREDLMAAGLSAVLKASAPRCGRFNPEQRDFLFGSDAGKVASVALAPLGQQGKLGLLALGSRDPNHYHRARSTEFLSRVSAVVAVAVAAESS